MPTHGVVAVYGCSGPSIVDGGVTTYDAHKGIVISRGRDKRTGVAEFCCAAVQYKWCGFGSCPTAGSPVSQEVQRNAVARVYAANNRASAARTARKAESLARRNSTENESPAAKRSCMA